MADPVLIISVSTTALVSGLSLLKDVVLPRWQSNEERTVETREVLDRAGKQLVTAIQAADEARRKVQLDLGGQYVTVRDFRAQLDQFIELEGQLAVRFGPERAIYKRFETAHLALRQISTELQFYKPASSDTDFLKRLDGYRSEAMEAQNDFFRTASRLIGPRRGMLKSG
ncbi:MAG: hypothetical protein ACR2GZ_01490 [Solirubrobacteraceae bacterium]